MSLLSCTTFYVENDHIACYTLAQINNCSRRFGDSTVTFISESTDEGHQFTDEGDGRVTETSGTIINLG